MAQITSMFFCLICLPVGGMHNLSILFCIVHCSSTSFSYKAFERFFISLEIKKYTALIVCIFRSEKYAKHLDLMGNFLDS